LKIIDKLYLNENNIIVKSKTSIKIDNYPLAGYSLKLVDNKFFIQHPYGYIFKIDNQNFFNLIHSIPVEDGVFQKDLIFLSYNSSLILLSADSQEYQDALLFQEQEYQLQFIPFSDVNEGDILNFKFNGADKMFTYIGETFSYPFKIVSNSWNHNHISILLFTEKIVHRYCFFNLDTKSILLLSKFPLITNNSGRSPDFISKAFSLNQINKLFLSSFSYQLLNPFPYEQFSLSYFSKNTSFSPYYLLDYSLSLNDYQHIVSSLFNPRTSRITFEDGTSNTPLIYKFIFDLKENIFDISNYSEQCFDFLSTLTESNEKLNLYYLFDVLNFKSDFQDFSDFVLDHMKIISQDESPNFKKLYQSIVEESSVRSIRYSHQKKLFLEKLKPLTDPSLPFYSLFNPPYIKEEVKDIKKKGFFRFLSS
jgi:hypothetical protein